MCNSMIKSFIFEGHAKILPLKTCSASLIDISMNIESECYAGQIFHENELSIVHHRKDTRVS